MNLDDLRTVNVFLGIEPDATGKYDANWIFRTLIPALEERLGLRYGAFWPLGDEVEVSISTPDAMFRGTGSTFEAAFLAAAAKAVSDA